MCRNVDEASYDVFLMKLLRWSRASAVASDGEDREVIDAETDLELLVEDQLNWT